MKIFCNYCKETTHCIEDCTKLYCRKCRVFGHHDSKCTYEYKCPKCDLSTCKSGDCDRSFRDVWGLIRRIGEYIEVIMETPDTKYTADAMALEVIVREMRELKLGTIMADGYGAVTTKKRKADDIYRKFYLDKWGIGPEQVCEEWDTAVKKAIFQGGYGHSVYPTHICHGVVSEQDYVLLQKSQKHLEAGLVASYCIQSLKKLDTKYGETS